MKKAFRISSICILIFAALFFGLTPSAFHNQLTEIGMIIMIVSGILMIISMGITFGLLLMIDAEEQEQSWRDLDKRIEEHKQSLKDKYKPIY